MSSSLYAGISGLNAMQMQLDVIGNNIANANTVGYKASRIMFSDILSQSLTGGGGGTMQIGRGVTVGGISTEFAAGTFETTANATDLSIDGDGFFMVRDAEGGVYYTRAGAFSVDDKGYLVDINNYKVQGRNLMSPDPMAVTNISLRDVQSDPRATSEISVGANLDASTQVGDVFTIAQTVYDTLGTSHTLRVEFTKGEVAGAWEAKALVVGAGAGGADIVHNSVGSASAHNTATAYGAGAYAMHGGSVWQTGGAVEGGFNSWSEVPSPAWVDGDYDPGAVVAHDASFWRAAAGASAGEEPGVDAAWTEITAHDIGTTYASGDYAVHGGSVYQTSAAVEGAFNPWTEQTDLRWSSSDGIVYGHIDVTFGNDGRLTAPVADVALSFAGLANAAQDLHVNWQLAGVGVEPLTGYASTSVVKSLIQDGYSSGELRSISVTESGIITGFFTNGQTASIGQVMLASFSNPLGLQRMGANLFGETLMSGVAIQNAPGTGGMGTVISSSLELSNADIAKEFINMITAQRAYQASAKVVTTTDQMMQELMNVKR